MKGFKKWWKEEGFYYEYEGMCEDAWKEALKWVLERETELKPNEWDFIDVCNAIREELKEK